MNKKLATIYLHLFGITFGYIYLSAIATQKLFPINYWVLTIVFALYLALISLAYLMGQKK